MTGRTSEQKVQDAARARARRAAGGHESRAAYMREYRAKNPDVVRRQRLREREQRTGCTQEMYDLLLAQQSGCCAICRMPEAANRDGKLHADHDHATGRVRGLLCNACNMALGLLRDDRSRLAAAIEYLNRGDA